MKANTEVAIISYLTIFGTIYAYYKNQHAEKTEFNSFHIRQTFGLFASFFLLGYFVGYFNSWAVTMSFYLFYFILWIYGFSGALQNQKRTVPILGIFFQNTFKNL